MQPFQAESKRLLELMIHSIYTNREIFLRELISNASDAIDKMYAKSLEDQEIDFDPQAFYIEIHPDAEKRTLTIRDTGIGMTREELEENLGTIAKSGTEAFRRSMDQAKTTEDAIHLIGQFGVGFYSAFMVADKVEVLTRAYGSEEAFRWMSEGVEGFTIEPAEKEQVGTEITLYLKPDGEENFGQYLESWTLKRLVKEYSNYVRYPIRMEAIKSRKKEEKDADGKDQWETYTEMETLNSMVPIWNRNRNELTDEDYKAFYHQENFGIGDPLTWITMVADGTLSYRAILYIPSSLPWDFYSKDYKKGLQLYASGVKIMDHCEALLPDEYAFVRGVVSSEDLHLNISRETLQQNRELRAIAKKIEQKITDELKKMLKNDREKYETFFHLFGTQLKAGIYQSYGMKKDPLADLLLFPTSKNEETRTLAEMVEDMDASEEKASEPSVTAEDGDAAASAQESSDSEEEAAPSPLLYAAGDSTERLNRLPLLQSLREEGTEILYLTEEIDEFVVQMMQEYAGHPFQSALAADLPEEQKSEKDDGADEAIWTKIKDVLGEEVVDVQPSSRLSDHAVALVAQGPVSIEMEKAFRRRPGDQKITAQKVIEINPDHPVFTKLRALMDAGDEEKFKTYTHLLYDQARLIEGLPIEDPVRFAEAVQSLMA